MSTRPRAGIFVILMVSACGPAADVGGDAGPGDMCTGSRTRCQGAVYQTCEGGRFVTQESCAAPEVCAADLGCVQCDPKNARVCAGNDVYECRADGTRGAKIETCPDVDGCNNGSCGGANDCQGAGATLIYVVDESYQLWSFNPLNNMNTFARIGQLDCPARASWPDWADPTATPFSMSVDRNTTAWVLYTSGEIFHVSTQDASCQQTTFAAGTLGYQLFGMGFVSDAPGSQQEKLYISGGAAADPSGGNLGVVDPATLQVTTAGPLPAAEYAPELTGTGAAELYGYYPGQFSTFVAKMDKGTGQNLQTWPLPPLGAPVKAWAFAHWGGRFYIFITTDDGFGGGSSDVVLLDPMTGSATTIVPDHGHVIVGAGVSTCAPITIP